MRAIRAISLACLVASAATAQQANIVGFTHSWSASYTDRLGQNAVEIDCLQRFNSRDYRNWILDRADPLGNGMRLVGLRVRVQDQNIGTPETFALVGYRESPINPNVPDSSGAISDNVNPGGRWFRTAAIPFPVTGTSGAAGATVLFGINPPARPLFHDPNLDDVFLGVGLNSGTWPTDGLGVIITHAQPTTPPASPPPLDLAGPRISDIVNSSTPNLCCSVATTGGVPTGAVANWPNGAGGQVFQLQVDVLAQVASGVSVTQTNQANYLISAPINPPANSLLVPMGGTTNMISGLHPDMNNATNSTPARADEIGFVINELNRRNSPCVVIAGFTAPAFGIYPDGTLPLAALFPDPDSRGLLCVDPGNGASMFLGLSNANGTFQFMFPISPALRATLPPLGPIDVIWQGFVVDPTLTEVIGTGCVTQHL